MNFRRKDQRSCDGRGGGGSGDIIFHSLGRKVSIVYSIEYRTRVSVLSYDLEPPTPAHASECWRAINTGNRKTEGGGEPFSTGKAVGGTNHRQHRDCGTLYNILYSLFLTPRSSSGRKTFLFPSQDDGNWRVCDQDRSSEAAIGEGGRAAPRFAS